MLSKKTFAMWMFLVLALVSTSALAETKVAFVNVARLLQESPQVKAVRDEIQKEFARRSDDLVAQQKQVKQLQDKLTRDSAIMSEAESKRLERDIVSRRRQLKNAQSEFQEDLALRQNEKLGKLRQMIAEVIVDVAKAEKCDMVFESGVVWASDKVDLTDKVLAAMQKQ